MYMYWIEDNFFWLFVKKPAFFFIYQYAKEMYERKVTTVGRELRVRLNLKGSRKRPSDFIASRLPKRQAKQNALKFYMESDDLEDNESRSTSDEEITFPKKRKMDSGYDIDKLQNTFQKVKIAEVREEISKVFDSWKKVYKRQKWITEINRQ